MQWLPLTWGSCRFRGTCLAVYLYIIVSRWLHAKALGADCLSPIKKLWHLACHLDFFSENQEEIQALSLLFTSPLLPPKPKNLLLQRHDCITLHESFLWARHQHNSQNCQKVSFFFLYLFYQTKAEVDWKAEEVFWGASQQCRSPLPLLCCALLKPPRPLTRLRFIKDLLRRVSIMSLTFEDSRFGCLGCEGARSWQTTSCFFFLSSDSAGRLSTAKMRYHL